LSGVISKLSSRWELLEGGKVVQIFLYKSDEGLWNSPFAIGDGTPSSSFLSDSFSMAAASGDVSRSLRPGDMIYLVFFLH